MRGLCLLMKLIVDGDIGDNAREKVLLGKGVPLTEILPDGNIKPRIINIDDPIHKVAANALKSNVMKKANEACGEFQVGNGIKGGAEILIAFVRITIELNPTFILCKVDCNNAFNSPYHRKIMEATNEYLPEASSYLATLLKYPIQIDISNFRKKKNMRVDMERGVTQGNPMSGIYFNLCRVNALKVVRREHGRIQMISYHDDDYFLGLPEDVFEALATYDINMDTIGINRNRLKSQLYDPSGMYGDITEQCQQHGCTFVPTDQGIMVCGSPVGSREFMVNYVRGIVQNSIRNQLQDIKRVFLTPNGEVKKENQTIYQLVRLCIPSQLTFLWRTCIPDVTEEAATNLDAIVDEFLILLFDCRHHVEAMNMEDKMNLIKRIHLKFSKAGMGITPSRAIIGAAYVGSITLAFNYLNNIIPDLKERWVNQNNRSYVLFHQYLSMGKDMCPNLNEITVESMQNKSFCQVQKIISNGIQTQMENDIDRSMAQGRPVGGNELLFARLDTWSQEKAIQHLANKESFNYAFLTANPGAKLCGMSNEAFNIAVQHRLLIPLGESYTTCRCGAQVGPFFSHCYKCPLMNVRNQIRNNLHKEFKNKFADIMKMRIETANLNRRVDNVEPRLEDYFERRNMEPQPPDPDPGPNYFQSSQFDARGFQNGVKVRADMRVQMTDLNSNLIIDYTFVEPTATSYIGTYNKAGQAAKKGKENKLKNEYKHWNVDNNNNQGANNFKVIAVETFGVVIVDDIHLIFNKFIHEKENNARVLQSVMQQLSVAFHTIRAKQFYDMVQKRLVIRPLPN